MKHKYHHIGFASMLLACSMPLHAQQLHKQMQPEGNGVEQLARPRTPGYTLPLAKQGNSLPSYSISTQKISFKSTQSQQSTPSRVREYAPQLMGFVWGAQSATLNHIGSDGSLTPTSVAISSMMGVPGGGYIADGNYYTTAGYVYPSFSVYYGFAYDTEKWQMQNNGAPYTLSASMLPTDLTYCSADATVYGCFPNAAANGYEFGTLDMASGDHNIIAPLAEAWNAIASDASGQIYAINMSGDLLKVDRTNGSATTVGATGYVPKNVSSATIDARTGVMYWTVSNDTEGCLCTVDLTTGVATKIADFPNKEQVYGLAILPPAAADKAPAAGSNLSLSFADDSLEGCLVFDAPATLFDESEATGSVDYKVVIEGQTVATGSCNYGEKGVSSPLFIMSAPGQYKAVLTFSNAVGESPKAEVSKFIGADAPTMPLNAKATYNAETEDCVVTWDAPAGSANGGYVNPDQITYTVIRRPDMVNLGTDLKERTVTDKLPVPDKYTKYSYSISATYKNISSYAANTNSIALGNIVPPFSDNFNDAKALDSYIVIDGNGDSRSWSSYYSMLLASFGPAYGSEKTTADEWLMTPAIKLDASKFYKLNFKAGSSGTSWTESFEVAIGKEPTVEGMKTVLMPTTSVSTAGFFALSPFETYIHVPEDGIYHLGIHHNTAEGAYIFYLDDLSISDPIDAAAPEAVTDLTLTPDADGAKTVRIEFTCPANDLSGTALPFLDRVEVKCDDKLVYTLTSPVPGSKASFEVEVPTSGMHKFTVTAYNGSVEGKPAIAEAHVGLNVPKTPENILATTDSDDNVTITWDAVSTDINGKTLPEDGVSYMIIRLLNGKQEIVVDNYKDTKYTYKPLAEGQTQDFFQFAVFAKSEAGFSTANVTPSLAVGKPYKLPYWESFSNGSLNYAVSAYPLSGQGGWQLFSDQSFSNGVKSFDADNGMIGMYGPTVGDAARLFTGKIDLTQATHPELSFMTYNLQGSADLLDLNELTILVDAGEGYKPVKTYVINEVAGGKRGWAKVNLDLSAYAGKSVQIAFDAVTKVYLYTLIDCMQIADRLDNDLKVTECIAPKRVDLNKEFNVTATVENVGRNTAEGYKVNLVLNGDVVMEQDGVAIAPDQTAQFTFPVTLNATAEPDNTIAVEVSYSADQNADNNSSATTPLHVNFERFPTVQNLKAEYDKVVKKVNLSWEAPAIPSAESTPETEDFESAETSEVFPTEFNDWTFRDVDQGYIGGIRGIELPGIQTGSQQGWWVMDANHKVLAENGSFKANSGSKYLAQMYTMDKQGQEPVKCDDWIISPWLNEKAQTISFYARSYGGDDSRERFEFLYSTTGTEPADFTRLKAVLSVPDKWTQYSYEVPEGTKYFAIRCTSVFQFMLFIDDVTFIPANGNNMVLSGYNVFVDGVLKSETPTAETRFTVDGSNHKPSTVYSVSAVYTRGESVSSHTNAVETSLDDIFNAPVVTTERQAIIVDKVAGETCTVAAADGKVFFHNTLAGRTRIPLHSGIYVVKVADKVYKVQVK